MTSEVYTAEEMRERAVNVRAEYSTYYGRVDHEHETAIVDEIDYILHGDMWKEKK